MNAICAFLSQKKEVLEYKKIKPNKFRTRKIGKPYGQEDRNVKERSGDGAGSKSLRK